jgi:phage-related protein
MIDERQLLIQNDATDDELDVSDGKTKKRDIRRTGALRLNVNARHGSAFHRFKQIIHSYRRTSAEQSDEQVDEVERTLSASVDAQRTILFLSMDAQFIIEHYSAIIVDSSTRKIAVHVLV